MPQPQANVRIVLVLFVIVWFVVFPGSGGPGYLTSPSTTKQRLELQRHAHSVLNSTNWGDFSPPQAYEPQGTAHHWLNITGFRELDGLAWDDLSHFRDRCVEWSRRVSPAEEKPLEPNKWDTGQVGTTWQNATGLVKGSWVRRPGSFAPRWPGSYNFTRMTPGIPWNGGEWAEWARNVSASEGTMLLRVADKRRALKYDEDHGQDGEGRPLLHTGGLVREVAATATIEPAGHGRFEMRMYGVHWPRQGNMLLTTSSEKFGGIFGLPHLTPDANYFRSSRMLLNETIGEALRKRKNASSSDQNNPLTSRTTSVEETWDQAPLCEYVLYLQMQPLNPWEVPRKAKAAPERDPNQTVADDIEKELRNPTGRAIPAVPELQMSAIFYSPDCGYFLESKGPPDFPRAQGRHLVGVKEEVYLYSLKVWVMAFAAVVFGQLHLFKGQMRESYTPSTMGRISFWTVAVMVLGDGLMFSSAAVVGLDSQTAFLAALLLSFALFMSMMMGGSFLSEIYKVQEREWRREDHIRTPNHNTPRPPSTPAPTADSLPQPVTAGPPPRPATPPILVPSDQDMDDPEVAANQAGAAPSTPDTTNSNPRRRGRAAPFSTITCRLIFLGTIVLFLSLASNTWRRSLRAAYVNTLSLAYLSFWVPQIVRNTRRNSRRAFSWRFMIGQSTLRLAPFAYFYLREDNLLLSDTDWRAFCVLAGWVWAQLWVLAFQDVLGPRFGVPKGWMPEAWDYHPVLREDNLEAGGLPLGLVSESAPGSPALERVRSRSLSSVDGRGGWRDKVRDGGGSGSGPRRTYTREVDCAICREVLEVPVVRAGEAADPAGGGVAGALERRKYMVTPCRHMFHSACLEGWLRFRLQCPICREELPPL